MKQRHASNPSVENTLYKTQYTIHQERTDLVASKQFALFQGTARNLEFAAFHVFFAESRRPKRHFQTINYQPSPRQVINHRNRQLFYPFISSSKAHISLFFALFFQQTNHSITDIAHCDHLRCHTPIFTEKVDSK